MRPDLTARSCCGPGPVLPDLRIDSGSRVGVEVTLGKTDADSTEELVERYALIAGDPDAPETRIRDDLGALFLRLGAAGCRARRRAAAGLAAGRPGPAPRAWHPGCGARAASPRSGRGRGRAGADPAVAARSQRPSASGEDGCRSRTSWATRCVVPDELPAVEVRGDVTTSQTRRLIAERHRHLRDEPHVLPPGRRGGGRARPARARGGRDRRGPGLRPARQHRHGRGRKGRRRPGRRDRGHRRRRRHLDGPTVGGLLPRLARRRVRRRRLRRTAVGGRRATTTTGRS